MGERGDCVRCPPHRRNAPLAFAPRHQPTCQPPLLDRKGPELLAGDVVTIEPGLYRKDLGGVRVEDMIVIAEQGCENLNQLPEGLAWK